MFEARIQSRFPKPGVAGSNPAEGADLRFPLYSLTASLSSGPSVDVEGDYLAIRKAGGVILNPVGYLVVHDIEVVCPKVKRRASLISSSGRLTSVTASRSKSACISARSSSMISPTASPISRAMSSLMGEAYRRVSAAPRHRVGGLLPLDEIAEICHPLAVPSRQGDDRDDPHSEDDLPSRNPMANVAISTRRPRRIALDDMSVFDSYELSSRSDQPFPMCR